MDKQSKAPGVYRAILCVLTLAPAPVFYAIWQPYNTCLLQLPAAGGVWQLLTRVERMAGYADLLTLFRESNGVEDLF